MIIVTRKHLKEAMRAYPDAAVEIESWMTVVQAARWKNMAELVRTFQDADEVDGYTIFNIRHNRYRLITVVHYSKRNNGGNTQGHIYIRSLLKHKDYDQRSQWDRRYKR